MADASLTVTPGRATGRNHAALTAVGVTVQACRASGRVRVASTGVAVTVRASRASGRVRVASTAIGATLSAARSVGRVHSLSISSDWQPVSLRAVGRSTPFVPISTTSRLLMSGSGSGRSNWTGVGSFSGGTATVIPSGLRPSWTFIRGSEVYAFPVNPNKGGSPSQVLRTSTAVSSASDGTILVWQGRPEVPKSQFAGVILSQDQHDALVQWFGKPSEVQLIDDLGRSMLVWVTNLSLKRAPRQHFPWRHTYTCDYVLIFPSAV